MELNREQIVKALECCSTDIPNCHECPYKECKPSLSREALALIRELTEDNEKLGIKNFDLICELSRIKEDTVRKMQDMLKEELNNVSRWAMHGDETEYFIIGKAFIDQIAKELLEEGENG